MRAAVLALLVVFASACGSHVRVRPSEDGGLPDAGEPDSGDPDEIDFDSLFPGDRLLEVDLTFTEDAWATLLADPLVDVYVPARLTYDGIVLDPVGVRLKGNSSRRSVAMSGGERFSFKVDIDHYVDGQKLFGVDKINLNNGFKDPTCMRERLAADLYDAVGVPTVKAAHARLSRNGTYFGLYTVVEQVDREFLRARFPDDSGDLVKPEPPAGSLVWRGDSIEDYPEIGLRTNEDALEHEALIRFLDVLNHAPPDALETALPEVFDVDGYLRYLAVTIAIVNLDSYLGMGHNYYLFEDRAAGRIVFLPWDLNEAYGNFACRFTPEQLLSLPYANPICAPPFDRPLFANVIAVPTWRRVLETEISDLLDDEWASDAFAVRVHETADLVRDAVREDPTAFFRFDEFEQALDRDLVRPGPGPVGGTFFGLTSFAERRSAALRAQLP